MSPNSDMENLDVNSGVPRVWPDGRVSCLCQSVPLFAGEQNVSAAEVNGRASQFNQPAHQLGLELTSPATRPEFSCVFRGATIHSWFLATQSTIEWSIAFRLAANRRAPCHAVNPPFLATHPAAGWPETGT